MSPGTGGGYKPGTLLFHAAVHIIRSISQKGSGIVQNIIDIHAHILPGLDDGSSNWEETETLLEMAWEQGIRHIIATPHFSKRTDRSEQEGLWDKMASIRKREKHGMSFSLGQEILYFEELPDYLEKGWALSLAGSRYVLVEFSPAAAFSSMLRAVRQLAGSGYLPVLAHVERYLCLHEKEHLEELIEGGAYAQMNYRSLEGSVVSSRTRWCRRQVLAGNIHFLGTDTHHADYRTPRIEKAAAWLVRHAGKERAEQLVCGNPGHILADRVLARQ